MALGHDDRAAADAGLSAAADRVVAALGDAPPRCGQTKVVAVDGRSGAGKSTLARALGQRLDAPVLQLEGLYDGWDGLERGVARLASDVLAPLARGEEAQVPQWDWHADAWDTPRRLPAGLPVLVVEGVGAGAAAPARHASVVVWVDTPDGVRRDRALTRDGATYEPFWETWARQEEQLLRDDDIRSRADLIVQM